MGEGRGEGRFNYKRLDGFSILNNFDLIAGLADERARVAADEGIPADVFAAFDGFKKE